MMLNQVKHKRDRNWDGCLTVYLVHTVYHCTDSKQHCPCASLQDIPVHKCKTDIRTGPALPQMKYATINPPMYIFNMLASRCPLCSDLAPVVTWVTALCLKPPCEDLSLWHTTLNGGIFGWRRKLRGKGEKQENWSILLWIETDAFGWRTEAGLWQREKLNKYDLVPKWDIQCLIKVTHITKRLMAKWKQNNGIFLKDNK